MRSVVLRESTVRYAVLIFSISGVALLSIMAAMTDVRSVSLSNLEDHLGERVEASGLVVGAVHHESGSAEILISDTTATAVVFVERSSREVKPGDRITIVGEPYRMGGTIQITVQSDSGIDLTEAPGIPKYFIGAPVGLIYSTSGTVAAPSSTGWDSFSATLRISGSDSSPEVILVTINWVKADYEPRAGDRIAVTGLLDDASQFTCFGPSSTVIGHRSETRGLHLVQLIGEMEYSPGNPPGDPLYLEGYLRWEPGGRSLYIGEEAEGARYSLRVETDGETHHLHKGDLIGLMNVSLRWDPEGLRYVLIPEQITLLESHGPWHISLSNLDWGVGEYEGCTVILEGTVVYSNSTLFLMDGEMGIAISGDREYREGAITIMGVIEEDPALNRYLLQVEEIIQ